MCFSFWVKVDFSSAWHVRWIVQSSIGKDKLERVLNYDNWYLQPSLVLNVLLSYLKNLNSRLNHSKSKIMKVREKVVSYFKCSGFGIFSLPCSSESGLHSRCFLYCVYTYKVPVSNCNMAVIIFDLSARFSSRITDFQIIKDEWGINLLFGPTGVHSSGACWRKKNSQQIKHYLST